MPSSRSLLGTLLTTFISIRCSHALHPDATDDVPQDPIEDLTPRPVPNDFTCQDPPYKTTIVSASPLVIYIQDFLTAQERNHLRAVTNNTFSPSAIAGTHGASSASTRTSHSTYLPASDPVLACISQRALAFQSPDLPLTHLEPPQLVRYGPGGAHYYRPHTDWFTDPRYTSRANGGNRKSSFFAYVYVAPDTTGGGTAFPMLEGKSGAWCERGWVDCDVPWEGGVVFRPLEGNAVFWENLREVEGSGLVGDERTLHEGLPLTSGEKIGMNIWTREAALGEEARVVEGYPVV